METTFEMRKVGGCVRDQLLGLESHDVDFSCQGGSDFPQFVGWVGTFALIKHVDVECFTVKAQFRDLGVCDFVWARQEGPNDAKGRPLWVRSGTFAQDAARRDFTWNALMLTESGELVDLFGGLQDLNDGVVRTVGSARESFLSDARRVCRALRFAVQFGFTLSDEVREAMSASEVQAAVAARPAETRRDELNKALNADALATMALLLSLPKGMQDAMMAGGVRFESTLKHKKGR